MTDASTDRIAASELLVHVAPPVARLTINRPEQRNALHERLWEAIADQLEAIGRDSSVRVVVITGAGDRAFAAGADITELRQVQGDPDRIDRYLRTIERVMATIETIPQPVIAAVNGAALGGGLELAVACDLRISVPTARFGIPASDLGIAISLQDTRRLVGLVGVGRAKDFLLTGKIVDANEALAIGLIERIATDFAADVEALVKVLLAKAPLSLQSVKRQVLAASLAQHPGSVDDGLGLARESWQSEDFREGVRSYLEKRRPQFTGR